jgi:hypothetical protein
MAVHRLDPALRKAYRKSMKLRQIIMNQTLSSQGPPAITVLANGGFVITWWDDSRTLGDSDGLSIKAQVFDADRGKVGSEFLVNTSTTSTQMLSKITSLSSGGFVITWGDMSGTLGDSDGYSVKAQIFDPIGTKIGGEFLVNTQTAGDQNYPAITGLLNGGFVIVWPSPGDGWDVKAQIFDPSGTKIGGEFLVNTETAGDQFFTSAIQLANGGFMISWGDHSTNTQWNQKAQIFNANGDRIGNEFIVVTGAVADITSLSNGNYVAIWNDTSGTLGDASGSGVKAQIFDATSTKIGSEFLVNTQTDDNQNAGGTMPLANGGFVVTWEDHSSRFGDGSSLSIKAQAFDANGEKLGNEFLVNTNTASTQFAPAIANLANGDFIIAWGDGSGTLGDSSEASVKAQVFSIDGVAATNQAPAFTSNGGGDSGARSISENTKAVATVVATDADAGTTLSYSISGGSDAAKFQIDATTGALAFKTAPNFETPTDVGGNNVYDVTVQVSDGSLTDTQALAVTVGNVNEQPSGSVTISGALSVGSILTASHSVVDPDGAGSGGYQWTRNGSNITGATGAKYTLTSADAGQAIAVKLIYTDGGGFAQTVASTAQTAASADPGVTITGTDLVTGEDGGTASLSVRLNKAPVDPVTLRFAVSDASESSLSVQTLTFTSANWNVAQTLM